MPPKGRRQQSPVAVDDKKKKTIRSEGSVVAGAPSDDVRLAFTAVADAVYAHLEKHFSKAAAAAWKAQPIEIPTDAADVDAMLKTRILMPLCHFLVDNEVRMIEESANSNALEDCQKLTNQLSTVSLGRLDVRSFIAWMDPRACQALQPAVETVFSEARHHNRDNVLVIEGRVRAVIVFKNREDKELFESRLVAKDRTHLGNLLDFSNVEKAVLVLAGESGSGKTFNAILPPYTSFEKIARNGHLALLINVNLSWEADLTKIKPRGTAGAEQHAAIKKRRDEMAAGFICAAVTEMTEGLVAGVAEFDADDEAGFVQTHQVVLVLDEAGGCPLLVRALISAAVAVRDHVRAALKLPRALQVTIIAVGTGIEGTDHRPGSLMSNYELITLQSNDATNVAAKVWQRLQHDNDVCNFATTIQYGVTVGDATCRQAHDLVHGNARAAVIFAGLIRDLPDSLKFHATPQNELPPNFTVVVRNLMKETALKFKRVNGLSSLTPAQYTCVFAQAVAMTRRRANATDAAVVGERDATLIKCKYGMITDRATVERKDSKPADTHELITTFDDCDIVLEKLFLGQRYLLSRAQIVIAEMVLGIGERTSSGEGFELVVADYALGAVLEAMATVSAAKTLLDPPQGTIPEGWEHVSRLVTWLGEGQVKRAPVKLLHLRCAAAPGRVAWQQEVTSLFSDHKTLATSHLVVVNGEKAAYGDLMIFVRHTDGTVAMFVLQCKRYLATTLSLCDASTELTKMGFGDRATANAFAAGSIVAALPNKPKEADGDAVANPAIAKWKDTVLNAVSNALSPLGEEDMPKRLGTAGFNEALDEPDWRDAVEGVLTKTGLELTSIVPSFWSKTLKSSITVKSAAIVVFGTPPAAFDDPSKLSVKSKREARAKLLETLRGHGRYFFAPTAIADPASGIAASLPPSLQEMYPLTVAMPRNGILASAQVHA